MSDFYTQCVETLSQRTPVMMLQGIGNRCLVTTPEGHCQGVIKRRVMLGGSLQYWGNCDHLLGRPTS